MTALNFREMSVFYARDRNKGVLYCPLKLQTKIWGVGSTLIAAPPTKTAEVLYDSTLT